MLIKLLFFLIVFCSNALIHATELEQKESHNIKEMLPTPFATNGVFVFLGPRQENPHLMDNVALDVVFALHQKAGPILVSSALIKSIILHPTLEELITTIKHEGWQDRNVYEEIVTEQKKIEEFLTKLPTILSTEEQQKVTENLQKISEDLDKKYGNYDFSPTFKRTLIRSFLYFNENEWIIKQVNSHLLLLIPKTYIESLIKKNNRADYFKTQKFSEPELNLGIKIDSFKDISSINDFAQKYVQPTTDDDGAFFVESLAEIFITKAEYKQSGKENFSIDHLPKWTLYLLGHGKPDFIAKISTRQFKKLLTFLATDLVTKLFVYNSCYAGGINAESIYKNERKPFFQAHPFAIISGSLSDAPTTRVIKYVLFNINSNSIDFVRKKLKPIQIAYSRFLKKITEEDTINFKELAYSLFPEALLLNDPHYVFSSPLIKLPGLEWFTVMDADENLVSIGDVLATTRTEPLNVENFFKRKQSPLGILFYANKVPFELIIPYTRFPMLVPMQFDKSIYQFDKISISIPITAFFKALSELREIATQKIFIINKLEVLEDFRANRLYTNVIIVHFPPPASEISKFIAYFTDDKEQKFKWNYLTDTLHPAPNYPAQYQMVIDTKIHHEQPFAGFQEKIEAREHIRKAQEKKLEEIKRKKATDVQGTKTALRFKKLKAGNIV